MTITYLFRSPGTGHSIEHLFDGIREVIDQCGAFRTRRITLPHISRNGRTVWQNGRVAFRVAKTPGLIHVTGDAHYVTLALPGQRTVLTVHDCIPLEKNRRRPLRFLFFWLFWYYLPIRRAAAVTVVSDRTRRDLIRYVGAVGQKAIVVPNGYHPAFTRQSRPLRKAKPVLLQIGTAPHKNLARLTAALEQLPCVLLIVGPLTDAQRTDLRQRAIRYEHYVNLDQAALVALYARCDLVTFVSTYEGFGLPVLEANAVGRAVITANQSPMCDGTAGAAHLVDPFDVLLIRAGIRRILEDDTYRDALIRAGYERAKQHTLERVANQYTTIYRQLLVNGFPKTIR